MLRKFRIILQFSIPVIALIYGLGDYLNWWDSLSGRSAALSGYDRLSSNEGYPKIFVFRNEPEFKGLYQFLRSRISAKEFINLKEEEKVPSLIARVGGTLGHELQSQLPPTWPNVRYVPDTLPIVFIYGVSKETSKTEGTGYMVCSLGDLRRWIEKSRETERFWVTTILIGGLSISLILLEFKK